MHYLTTCLSIICVSCSLCIGQPQLNFKSGFEPDVYITSNYGDLRGSAGATSHSRKRCLTYSDTRWEQFWNKINQYGYQLAA